jgi:hypothetical protein
MLLSALIAAQHSNAQCTSSSQNNGGTFINTGAGFAWGSPGNAQLSDNLYASSSQLIGILSSSTSDYLQVTNFGFAIPPAATICQILVDVERHAGGIGIGSSIKDQSVKIVQGGVISGNEEALAGAWPGADAYANYGTSAPQALWGLTWLPADINATNFGVAISSKLNAGLAALFLTPAIDHVRITVIYDTNVLGISLYNFFAQKNNGVGVLTWTASSDSSYNTFLVQRSADSKNWQTLSVVSANQQHQQYQYEDATPPEGTSYYRLGLQSSNGNLTYSAIRAIEFQESTELSVYPNPAFSMISISNHTPIRRIAIKGLDGRMIRSITVSSPALKVEISVQDLPSGLYLLQVDDHVLKLVRR